MDRTVVHTGFGKHQLLLHPGDVTFHWVQVDDPARSGNSPCAVARPASKEIGASRMLEPTSSVLVEVVDLGDRGARQIGAQERATELLQARASEIANAINKAAAVTLAALASVEEHSGWRVTSLQTAFGLTLAAESGIIVGKASAEATLEVTLTLERS